MKNFGSFVLTRFGDADRYPQRLNTLSKTQNAGEITATG
jgi:hypothetical protein